MPFSVIPVKTGIQEIQEVLDSRLRGSDDYGDFLRVRHFCPFEVQPLLLKSSWILKRLQKVFCNLSCEANDFKEKRI